MPTGRPCRLTRVPPCAVTVPPQGTAAAHSPRRHEHPRPDAAGPGGRGHSPELRKQRRLACKQTHGRGRPHAAPEGPRGLRAGAESGEAEAGGAGGARLSGKHKAGRRVRAGFKSASVPRLPRGRTSTGRRPSNRDPAGRPPAPPHPPPPGPTSGRRSAIPAGGLQCSGSFSGAPTSARGLPGRGVATLTSLAPGLLALRSLGSGWWPRSDASWVSVGRQRALPGDVIHPSEKDRASPRRPLPTARTPERGPRAGRGGDRSRGRRQLCAWTCYKPETRVQTAAPALAPQHSTKGPP